MKIVINLIALLSMERRRHNNITTLYKDFRRLKINIKNNITYYETLVSIKLSWVIDQITVQSELTQIFKDKTATIQLKALYCYGEGQTSGQGVIHNILVYTV